MQAFRSEVALKHVLRPNSMPGKYLNSKVSSDSGVATITLGGRLPIASRRFLDERIDRQVPLWLQLPRGPLYSFVTIPYSCRYNFSGDGFALLSMEVQKLKRLSRAYPAKRRKPRKK